MIAAPISADAFAELVARSARDHHIPGMSAAVSIGSTLLQAASGVLNVRTGAPVTAGSVFQIGSITKVFTGTLVMQLVADGTVDLDAPVSRYLPDLQIAGAPIAAAITVRMLLAHTSGIAGDLFVDTGRNADAAQRYAERCVELDYVHAPGRFSYCNSGYVLLGRIIETLTNKPWSQVLRERLLEPLGIDALIDAETAPLFGTAAGHVLDANGVLGLTAAPYLPRSTEAAGARLSMSAASLLRFARVHLRDGAGPDGVPVLASEHAREMRVAQVDLPFEVHGNTQYGLAWALRPAGYAHNGATIGQSAFLLVVPEHDMAICALTNVSSGGAAASFDTIVRAVAGLPDGVVPRGGGDAPDAAIGALTGRYVTQMSAIDVHATDGVLRATVTPREGMQFAHLPPHHYALDPLGGNAFRSTDALDGATSVTGFTDFDAGVPAYLFWGGRLARRV